MKVLVCGSRLWTDVYPILRELRKLPLTTTIIHGAARGADTLAGEVAMGLGFHEVIAVPADWKRHGRAAGPIRNRKMLDMRPNMILVFHEDLEHSKGTKNMIVISRQAGIEVRVFNF